MRLTGYVNRQNVRIWGSENLNAFEEHQRDSPEVSGWSALSQNRVFEHFSFMKTL